MAAAAAYVGNDELWRNCALWLTRWDVLRSDHRVNWPQATIVDLANTLRDGVLLCKLLSRIDPNCIDMKSVNLKPTMAQVSYLTVGHSLLIEPLFFSVPVPEEYRYIPGDLCR